MGASTWPFIGISPNIFPRTGVFVSLLCSRRIGGFESQRAAQYEEAGQRHDQPVPLQYHDQQSDHHAGLRGRVGSDDGVPHTDHLGRFKRGIRVLGSCRYHRDCSPHHSDAAWRHFDVDAGAFDFKRLDRHLFGRRRGQCGGERSEPSHPLGDHPSVLSAVHFVHVGSVRPCPDCRDDAGWAIGADVQSGSTELYVLCSGAVLSHLGGLCDLCGQGLGLCADRQGYGP